MQKSAEKIDENSKPTQEQSINEAKFPEESEPAKEMEESKELLTIIYDRKSVKESRVSHEKFEETIENIENEQIEEVYDKKTQKSENENEREEKVEQNLEENAPTEKLEEPLGKIDSRSTLRNSVEKMDEFSVEKKDEDYHHHQHLVADDEKTEEPNDKTELFSDGVKEECDLKIEEKEENLVSNDKSLHDEEEEMEHSSKDKEVLSESIENEDKLSNAGENDEFTEKPIIPDENDKEEEKWEENGEEDEKEVEQENEENEEKEKKDEKEEKGDEKVEEEPKKVISGEKSQIMTESVSSIPEEAKLVIVQGAVTSSTEIIVKKPVKEDLEKELSLQTQKIGSEESAFKKIAKTDSDCICKPEVNCLHIFFLPIVFLPLYSLLFLLLLFSNFPNCLGEKKFKATFVLTKLESLHNSAGSLN